MAKIEKLPSGNYCLRVFDKLTKKQKRFTAPTKSEVKQLAAEYELSLKEKTTPKDITLGVAIDEYIESKDKILSPSSIRGYLIIRNNAVKNLETMKISEITEKHLQKWVNENASKYSPKTIKSQFGLITAALRQNKINLDYKSILLPRIEKKEPIIPDEQQMGIILDIIEGTSVEIPVTLALTLGMRQSEIAGLKWTDYDGKHLYIHSAKVPNKNNKYQYKETTKSEASTRVIEVKGVAKERLDHAERTGEFISPMLPSSVLRKFQGLCDKNGLPHFTMHGQRHANASLMLAEGVPDKYAMERLGQSSPNMIKNIYQHLYDSKRKEASETVAGAFDRITKKEK